MNLLLNGTLLPVATVTSISYTFNWIVIFHYMFLTSILHRLQLFDLLSSTFHSMDGGALQPRVQYVLLNMYLVNRALLFLLLFPLPYLIRHPALDQFVSATQHPGWWTPSPTKSPVRNLCRLLVLSDLIIDQHFRMNRLCGRRLKSLRGSQRPRSQPPIRKSSHSCSTDTLKLFSDLAANHALLLRRCSTLSPTLSPTYYPVSNWTWFSIDIVSQSVVETTSLLLPLVSSQCSYRAIISIGPLSKQYFIPFSFPWSWINRLLALRNIRKWSF